MKAHTNRKVQLNKVDKMEDKKVERVFVLGAGISKHCGYPLTNDLLKEIISRLKTNDRDRSNILNFINNLYYKFNYDTENYPNVEEILSLLAISIEMESKKIPEAKYRYYIQDANEINRTILKNICQLFFEKLEKVNEKMAIFEFASCLKPKDIVISFNWDLNLEKALEYMKKEYIYYLDDKIDNKIIILKPHGSLNWFKQNEINLKEDCRELLPLIEGNNNVLIFKYLRRPNTTFKKDFIPFIVPPTLQKTICPELEIIWSCKNIG